MAALFLLFLVAGGIFWLAAFILAPWPALLALVGTLFVGVAMSGSG